MSKDVVAVSVDRVPSADESPYWMTVSLNVLNHLGINLYSNLPAVLSEAVANAWDADAETVSVTIDVANQHIEIVDDGNGMTRDEINARFLHVGYRRRDDESEGAGPISPKHKRKVMGRKGLGKLSLFSIARTVEVHSAAQRPLGDETGEVQRNGFIMDIDEIERAILADADESSQPTTSLVYRPEPVPEEDIEISRGTKIVLTRLKKEPSKTAPYLKRRLARRFGMLGEKFELKVDNESVSVADRNLLGIARYLWVYGSDQYFEDCKKKVSADAIVEHRPSISYKGEELFGWIASARSSTDLRAKDDGDDHLNRISIMVRQKLAQEDVLGVADRGGLFTKYLFGELYADFLDLDDEADIATSSRQSIVEDDPRYEQVVAFVKDELKYLDGAWNKLREQDGENEARKIEVIDTWFKSLDHDDRKAAKALFGKIHAIPGEGDQRRRLYASSVLAFEGLRRRRRLSLIQETAPENLPALITAFESIDDIEAAMFYEVVQDRLSIIKKFEGLLDDNALEKALQQYLFEHLWLLDPSWERTTVPVMEKKISSIIEEASAKSQEILDSRVDIAYRQSAASHVIVELKRASVVTNSFDLAKQVSKYREGVLSSLRRTEGDHVDLQVVIVVGKDLSDWSNTDGIGTSREMLRAQSTRVMTYDRLVRDALASYEEYLEKHRELGPLRELLARIEDELGGAADAGPSDEQADAS